MITDPIGDMLTRIRNANQALHETVEMPSSGMKREIARILQEEGYIDGSRSSKGETHDTLVVTLRYGAEPRARDLGAEARVQARPARLRQEGPAASRARRDGRRHPVSTSQRRVTGRQAQEQGVGGEVLCYVW